MSKLFFLFLVFPICLYLVVPWGGEIKLGFIAVISTSMLAISLGFLIGKIVSKAVSKNRNQNIVYSLYRMNFVLSVLLVISLAINFHITYSIGFRSPLLDVGLRGDVYRAAGILWPINVSLAPLSFALAGYLVMQKGIWKICIPMIAVLLLFILNYGMKGVLIGVLCPFLVMVYWLGNISTNRSSIYLISKSRMKLFIILVLFGLFVFYLVNAARASNEYGIYDLFFEIYHYLIPPFANFNFILGEYFDFPYMLGGVFEPFYRVVGLGVRPLDMLDPALLIHPTWNVWSYFANFYVSGGVFEVILGSLYIGLFTGGVEERVISKKGFVALCGYSQSVLLIIFLHNSYYFQSLSPYLIMLFAYLIHIYAYKGGADEYTCFK